MKVIVVSGDVAYEVVDEDTPVDPIIITPVSPTTEFDPPMSAVETPKSDQPLSTQPVSSTSSSLPCWGGLVVALLPILALGLVKQKTKDDRR
jgi:hypothetical protein